MRMFRAHALAAIAAIGLAGPVFAQASADLALQSAVTPAGPLTPGSTAQILLTFHNRGPDAAISAGAVSSGYEFVVDGQFDLYAAAPHPCAVYYDHFNSAPGEPHYLVAAVLTGDILAEETRVCTLGLFVYPEARGPYELTFRADAATPDPDESNNLVALNLLFAYPEPQPIPASATWSAFVLIALVLALGAVRNRDGTHPAS